MLLFKLKPVYEPGFGRWVQELSALISGQSDVDPKVVAVDWLRVWGLGFYSQLGFMCVN